MKKILICILFLLLSACHAQSSIAYLELRSQRFDVCLESCDADNTNDVEYQDGYQQKLENLITDFVGVYELEPWFIAKGEIIDRDMIVRLDPIRDNEDILSLLPYYKVKEVLFQGYQLGRFCDIDGLICNEPMDTYFGNIQALDYGFNANGGYYHIENTQSDDDLQIRDGAFIFTEDAVKMELLNYDKATKTLRYSYYDQGVYQQFDFSQGTNIDVFYVNHLTGNSMKYQKDNDGFYVGIYQPDKEVYYEMQSDGTLTLTFYDQQHFVMSVEMVDATVVFNIGMFYLDGWDRFQTPSLEDLLVDLDSHVFLGEQAVYTDYRIRYTKSFYYMDIIGQRSFTASEWDDFTFLDTFLGDITKADVNKELKNLMKKTSPYDLIGLSEEDFWAVYNDLLRLFDIENA